MNATEPNHQSTDETTAAPTAKRRNTWPMPEQHNKQSTAGNSSLHFGGKTGSGYFQGKSLGNPARPFKATGHKGGISRQGSKRG